MARETACFSADGLPGLVMRTRRRTGEGKRSRGGRRGFEEADSASVARAHLTSIHVQTATGCSSISQREDASH